MTSSFSSTWSWGAPSVLLATAPMLFFAARRFLQRPLWCRAALLLAILLQCSGYATLAHLAFDQSDHAAFLVSFICITLAPCMLALVWLSNLYRLQKSAAIENGTQGISTASFHLRLVMSVFSVVLCVSMSYFIFGFYFLAKFHSPVPVTTPKEALLRINYESKALASLQLGYSVELLFLVLLALGLMVFAFNQALPVRLLGAPSTEDKDRLSSSTLFVTSLMVMICAFQTYCVFFGGAESLDLLDMTNETSGGAALTYTTPFMLLAFGLALLQTNDVHLLESQSDKHAQLLTTFCNEKELVLC